MIHPLNHSLPGKNSRHLFFSELSPPSYRIKQGPNIRQATLNPLKNRLINKSRTFVARPFMIKNRFFNEFKHSNHNSQNSPSDHREVSIHKRVKIIFPINKKTHHEHHNDLREPIDWFFASNEDQAKKLDKAKHGINSLVQSERVATSEDHRGPQHVGASVHEVKDDEHEEKAQD